MVGCSNGGRHALVGATRLAKEFDGFLAGAPGYNLPMVAAAACMGRAELRARARTTFAARCRATTCGSWPTPCSQQCDALDGAADGIVGALAACQKTFELERLAASADGGQACLAPQQVAALEALVRGAERPERPAALRLVAVRRRARRERLAQLEAREPDTGLRRLAADRDARRGLARADLHDAADAASRARPQSLLEYLRGFDFDRDAPKILATTPEYPVSAMDFMAPTDWRNPQARGAQGRGRQGHRLPRRERRRVLGQATIDWYEKVRANNGGDASAFARFYPVPGMTHCGGGPSTDRFDLFGVLVDWVEHGKAPGPVTATVRADNRELPADWSRDALAAAL